MQFYTQAIHAPQVRCTEGLKDTGRSLKGEEKAKTAETIPVPKRIKVICGGSLVSSLTTTSSDECESGQMDSRITTMVSAEAVEQEAAASNWIHSLLLLVWRPSVFRHGVMPKK